MISILPNEVVSNMQKNLYVAGFTINNFDNKIFTGEITDTEMNDNLLKITNQNI